MNNEWWAVSLDDLTERIFEIRGDNTGAHYCGFKRTRLYAIEQMKKAFADLIEDMVYPAIKYGRPRTPEDEGEETGEAA